MIAWFRKTLKKHKTLVVSALFLAIYTTSIALAVPPAQPYSPGETLDPQCAPGSSNCTVTVSSGGSSQWDDVSGGINYAGGRVGIGTTTPQSALDVNGEIRGGSLNIVGTGSVTGIAAPSNAQAVLTYNTPTGYSNNGSTFDYYVFSYKNVNGSRIYSDNSANASVTDNGNNDTNESVTVSWDPASGVDGYRVIRNLTNNNTAAYDTTATSFVDDANSVAFSANPSDAVVTPKSSTYTNTNTISGNTTIGGTISATDADFSGNVIAKGILSGNPESVPTASAGPQMLWIPGLAAFRAGIVFDNSWSGDNVGLGSVAMGAGTMASGQLSTAFGYGSEASGTNSTAFGAGTIASGEYTSAFGVSTSAIGQFATSFGNHVTAASYGSFVIGSYNDYNLNTEDPANWVGTDPLFQIGNGQDDINHHNALTVLKNGNTSITGNLFVEGDITCSGSCGGGGGGGSTSQWTDVTGGINYAGGKVGIGSATPRAALDIAGDGAVLATGTFNSGIVVPNVDATSVMMWIPSLGSFRATSSSEASWDDSATLGYNSALFGYNTKATGQGSIAAGMYTSATGSNSTAFGYQTTAEGDSAVAMGRNTAAIGNFGIALGLGDVALGNYSSAIGYGAYALGNYSSAFGNSTSAGSYNTAVFGRYNIGGGDTANWVATDSLFEVGNGADQNNTSNAFTILKNGNIGINTATPRAALDIAGDGAILATGTFGSGITVPDLGAGTRMMWIPSQGAFRAGVVSADQWDSANVGQYSVAFGTDTIASNVLSTAFGATTTASGLASTAFGGNTIASGIVSTAFGSFTNAAGNASTAFGSYTTASALASTALGRYNIGGGDPSNWVSTDSLFEIGNGSTSFSKSNALTVLKNGNVGINTATPGVLLSVGSAAYDSTLNGGIIAHFENDAGTCDLDPTDTGGILCTSDMNAKKNITALADNSTWSFSTNITTDNNSIFAKLIALTPVQYNFNTENDSEIKHTGFIAQEVEQLFPDLVATNAQGRKSMNYVGLVPYTVEAIKEMNFNITKLSDLDRPNTWRQSLISWFGNSANGIKSLVVHDKVCVDSECLTKDDIHQLLEMKNRQNGGGNEGVTTVISVPDQKEDETPVDPKPENKEEETLPPVDAPADPVIEKAPDPVVPPVETPAPADTSAL